MTQPELIQHYTRLLAKVAQDYPTNTPSDWDNERNQEYVDHAAANLEAVRNGRKW